MRGGEDGIRRGKREGGRRRKEMESDEMSVRRNKQTTDTV